ncbi:MAG: hypothetical protein QM760_05020 [Nibricoccus sp.]
MGLDVWSFTGMVVWTNLPVKIAIFRPQKRIPYLDTGISPALNGSDVDLLRKKNFVQSDKYVEIVQKL